jgi:hypothetical protein
LDFLRRLAVLLILSRTINFISDSIFRGVPAETAQQLPLTAVLVRTGAFTHAVALPTALSVVQHQLETLLMLFKI